MRKDQPEPIIVWINRPKYFRDIFLGVFVKFSIDEARVPSLQIKVYSFDCVVIHPNLIIWSARSSQLSKDALCVFELSVRPQPKHAAVTGEKDEGYKGNGYYRPLRSFKPL
jgi:hypothetical protein